MYRTLICFTVFLQIRTTLQETCQTPDQIPGLCIPIRSCQVMLEALDKAPTPLTPQLINYLRGFQCGFSNMLKVCCPNSEINVNFDLPDVSHHRNLKFLPTDCGYLDTENKIFGGHVAGIMEFPWMARLSYKTKKGPDFKCGGTVISKHYILTAAHCLTNLQQTPLIGVRVGEFNIKTKVDCEVYKWQGEVCAPPYQDLSIKKIIPHPEYDAHYYANDIGLIQVSPIDTSLENARPVCLPVAESRSYNFTGRNLIVTGWGLTERGVASNKLLKVSLPLVPHQQCQEMYKKLAKLDFRQICAGGVANKDSCNGDSGGPLHVIGRINGEEHLVQQGIVSFGPSDCGKMTIAGVYTKVAAFMDWILENIET